MKLILICAIIIMHSGYCENNLSAWKTSDLAGEERVSSKPSYFTRLKLYCCQRTPEYKYSSNSNCTCGTTKSLSGRVVNGTAVEPNKYIWEVLIRITIIKILRHCTGSIITIIHILTAGHCLKNANENNIEIYPGMHNINLIDEENVLKHYVLKIIIHKRYHDQLKKNDIAILVTKDEIMFTPNVGPICLPSHKFNLEGELLKFMGWGDTKGTGDGNVLREIDLAFIPYHECMNDWSEILIKKMHICAYAHEKDVCNGDSGGGLFYLNPENNKYTQVGVLSYGDYRCKSNVSSIFTNVYTFMGWITSQISESKKRVTACTGDYSPNFHHRP